ncbi:MAG: hypothetical protein ACR2OX_02735 [Methyloligellaceae bacterium]
MACDTRLRLENIPEAVQKTYKVSAREVAIFTRLETGPYHDGVCFANGAEVILQAFDEGVKATVINALLSPAKERETVDAV